METIERIVDFLNGIGIATRRAHVPSTSFLPGVRILEGGLVYDPGTLAWPGDLLHEAGHLATAPGSLRAGLSDGVELPASVPHASEAEATAWAYAAVVHLQLDPAVLFHPGGYHGASESLIATYSLGVYPGAFGLAQSGMTSLAGGAGPPEGPVYPRMSRWLRP